jgi:hypothetical protein
MRLALRLACRASMFATMAAACSSSPSGTASPGAGGGGASTSTATGTTDGGAGGDASTKDAAPAVCNAFGGAYLVDGTCTPGSLALPTALCVRQTSCDAVVKTNADQTYEGTASNDMLQVTTNAPAAETCTGGHASGVVVLHCGGPKPSESCDGKATPVPLPGASAACCDVHATDCGPGQRCEPVDTLPGAVFTACVADDGKVAEGGACTRGVPTGATVGRDDCKKGLFCTDFGASTPETRACRKLCLADGDCPAGRACFGFGATPWTGACVETCALFGDACAAGTTCRAVPSHDAYGLRWNLRCGAAGAKQDGDGCATNEECGPALGCSGGTCRPYCDATHACPQGLACVAYTSRKAPGFGDSIGQCQ